MGHRGVEKIGARGDPAATRFLAGDAVRQRHRCDANARRRLDLLTGLEVTAIYASYAPAMQHVETVPHEGHASRASEGAVQSAQADTQREEHQ